MGKSEKEQQQKPSLAVRLIYLISNLVDRLAVIALVLLCAYGAYGIWDTNQLLSSAQATNLQQYKPKSEDRLTFEELKQKNSEVIAWLTVYGTKIDYPVTQAENDQKYINTDVLGKYSLAGSIFLAKDNAADFSDFNSIIYGHHMDKEAMFGSLDKFHGKKYFDQHRYGNLFYAGKDYGIEFFAFIKGDAYDWQLYNPGIQTMASREAYLDYLLAQASRTRSLEVKGTDRIVLLSTCATEPTNGRHILIGKLSDEPFADPFFKQREAKTFLGIDGQTWRQKIRRLVIWAAVLLAVIWLLWFIRRKAKKGSRGGDETTKALDD